MSDFQKKLKTFSEPYTTFIDASLMEGSYSKLQALSKFQESVWWAMKCIDDEELNKLEDHETKND